MTRCAGVGAKLGTDHVPLATQPGYFLELVKRVTVDGQVVLVAEPCRALMDLVCLKKIAWQGMDWLLPGLRIDFDVLALLRARILIRWNWYTNING